jgi:hypothetical protein
MRTRTITKFNKTLGEINDICKNIINYIKKIDEKALSFGKYSVYKNDGFTIDENNETIKIEYFEWGFYCGDFDYIEIPIKDFTGNYEKWCEKYVIETIEFMTKNKEMLKLK